MTTDDSEHFLQLKNQALHFLSFRPRSMAEVQGYLEKKSGRKDLISEVLSLLQEHSFLDDVAFARWLVESRSRTRPSGPLLLRQELLAKGISQEIIEQLFHQLDFRQLALQAAIAFREKHHIASRLPKDRQRLVQYLARRGFQWNYINSALSELD